jgi:ribosome modulation factor
MNEEPQIRLDPQAYDAGFAAGKAGEFSNACPYQPLTLESLSWHSGYIEGKDRSAARIREAKLLR